MQEAIKVFEWLSITFLASIIAPMLLPHVHFVDNVDVDTAGGGEADIDVDIDANDDIDTIC